MIRINLIAEQKRPVVARQARAGGGLSENLASLAFLGLMALGLLIAGGHYFLLSGEVSNREAQIRVAEAEVAELAPIIAEVEEFKSKRVELQRKIDVISNLKAKQRGPVRLMDEVSRALPELLWLTNLEENSTRLTISGQAFNTNAVATFLENLDKVPFFQEPVLRDTQRRGSTYSFVINLNFTFPPDVEEDETVNADATES